MQAERTRIQAMRDSKIHEHGKNNRIGTIVNTLGDDAWLN